MIFCLTDICLNFFTVSKMGNSFIWASIGRTGRRDGGGSYPGGRRRGGPSCADKVRSGESVEVWTAPHTAA